MKQAMIWLLVFVMCGSLTGCGSATPAEEFDYEMVDGEVIITGYHGTEQEIVIPKEIENRPVTEIGEKAFSGYDLTSVSFPKTMEIIGENAFAGCSCLTVADIPEGVKRIEAGAFYSCEALREVELPDSLEYLGGGSFMYCDALAELEIPDGFTGFHIEYRAWMKGTSVYQGETIVTPVSEETALIVDEQAYNIIMDYGTANYDVNLILK